MKYLLTLITAVLMVFSATAVVDPDHRTAAPGIFVTPHVEASMYMVRYYVYFTPREGNIYYRWMENSDGEWSEWSECGKVVPFNNPGTYTIEAYAKKMGKPESAHLTASFTVAYAGMSLAPGIGLRIADERGYDMILTSVYGDDIYFRWCREDGVWNRWSHYRDPVPFTEIGKYSIEAHCDYDYVSVSFEVDRSVAGDVEILPGDVNTDGSLNVADVTSMISFILGDIPNDFYEEAADINGDKVINVSDVTALISMIMDNK